MKFILNTLLLLTAILPLTTSWGDEQISKKVYQFTSKKGTPVFTDKKPKNKSYNTRIILSDKVTGVGSYPQNKQTIQSHNYPAYSYSSPRSRRSVKSNSKKRSLSTCKSYQRNWKYFSSKMRDGYQAKDYQYLESNRKKYRDLLFKYCNSLDLI